MITEDRPDDFEEVAIDKCRTDELRMDVERNVAQRGLVGMLIGRARSRGHVGEVLMARCSCQLPIRLLYPSMK